MISPKRRAVSFAVVVATVSEAFGVAEPVVVPVGVVLGVVLELDGALAAGGADEVCAAGEVTGEPPEQAVSTSAVTGTARAVRRDTRAG